MALIFEDPARGPPRMANFVSMFKTRICQSFIRGACDRSNCSYAHGDEEIRPIGNDRPFMGEAQGPIWDRLRRPPSPPRNMYRRRPSPNARGPPSPTRPPPMRRGPPLLDRNRNRSHSPIYKRRRSRSHSPARSPPRPMNGEVRQIKRLRPDHAEQEYSDVSGEGGNDIPQRRVRRVSPMSGGKDMYELQEQLKKISGEKQDLVQELRNLTSKMHAMEDALKRKEAMVKDLLMKLTVAEEKFQRLETQLREIVTAQIKVEKSKEHFESSQAELRKRLEDARGENQADLVPKPVEEDVLRRHQGVPPKSTVVHGGAGGGGGGGGDHGESSGRAVGRGSPGVRSKEATRRLDGVIQHEGEREREREMERGERERERERDRDRDRERENGLRREKCGSAGGVSHSGRKNHGADGEAHGLLRSKHDDSVSIVSSRGEPPVHREKSRGKGRDGPSFRVEGGDDVREEDMAAAVGGSAYKAPARAKLGSKIQDLGGGGGSALAGGVQDRGERDSRDREKDRERRKERESSRIESSNGVQDGRHVAGSGHAPEQLSAVDKEREREREEKRGRGRVGYTPERRDGFGQVPALQRVEQAPPVQKSAAVDRERDREIGRETEREGAGKTDRLASQVFSRDHSKVAIASSGGGWSRPKWGFARKGRREEDEDQDDENDNGGDDDEDDDDDDGDEEEEEGAVEENVSRRRDEKATTHGSDVEEEVRKKKGSADSTLRKKSEAGSPGHVQVQYSGDEEEGLADMEDQEGKKSTMAAPEHERGQ